MERNLVLFDPNSSPPDGGNYYRWGTPGSSVVDSTTRRYAELNAMIEDEVDHRVLLPLMQEAEQTLADNVVIIRLYARPVFLASWGDEVGGMNASAHFFTWNIDEWSRNDL